MSSPIRIAAAGAACAIGTTVEQIWAAARAGISRSASSSVHDRHFSPITMALLPDDALPEPAPQATTARFSSAQLRNLRLAKLALTDALASGELSSPTPIFVGVAEHAPNPVNNEAWLSALVDYAQVPNLGGEMHIFASGRAAAFEALAAAHAYLSQGPNRRAVVGGVDSFLDLRRLAELDLEGRILGERVMDGFIPGEGAAFLILTNAKAPAGKPFVEVKGCATARDKGHRKGDAPAKGEGLSNAIETLRSNMGSASPPAQVIFAGFNGEGDFAKEWGVAQLRHQDLLSPAALMEHPADRFADVGAAMGALLLAVADRALTLGHRDGPALVWSSSDGELRGCAWLQLQDA